MGGETSLLELMGAAPASAPAAPARPPDDHYRSPPECVRALASVVDLSGGVHECCAGDGTMAAAAADVLGAAAVYASTLYPADRTFFPVASGLDFLELRHLERRNVVTNPPYSMLYGKRLVRAGAACRIIEHALKLLIAAGDQAGSLCCLLDVRFSLSETRNKPGGLLHQFPPAVIHAFQDRVTMYPADTSPGPQSGGVQSFAWFVWQPPFQRPGADTILRADLNSRAFRHPDDARRFDLPVIRSRKTRASGG